jgi:hypothetical protein
MLQHRILCISPAQEVRRALCRLMTATGATTEFIDDPRHLPVEAPNLLVVDMRPPAAIDLAELGERLPGVRTICLVDANDHARMVECLGHAQCDSVLTADEQFDAEDFIHVSTRLLKREPIGIRTYFQGGVAVYDFSISSYQDKARVLDALAGYAELAGARGPVRERIVLVAEELLMNAIYHAPVDQDGRSQYDHLNRKQLSSLTFTRPVKVSCASNGRRFAIVATDEYGSLDKRTVLRFLAKSSSANLEPEQRVAGAGLGLVTMLKTASKLVYNLTVGASTEAIAVFDIDLIMDGQVGVRTLDIFTERCALTPIAAMAPTSERERRPSRLGARIVVAVSTALVVSGGAYVVERSPTAREAPRPAATAPPTTAPPTIEHAAAAAGIQVPSPPVAAAPVAPVAVAPETVQVAFESTPAGSEVVAEDGQPLGHTPFSVRLPATGHPQRFEFRRDGYRPVSKALALDHDASVVIELAAVTPRPEHAGSLGRSRRHGGDRIDPSGLMNPFHD